MSIENIFAVIFAAALGAGALVQVAKGVTGAYLATKKKTAPAGLRWIWRPLSILLGAAWGLALEGWPWGVAVGAGAGALTTVAFAVAQARLGGMGGRSAGDAPPSDPKAEEIER